MLQRASFVLALALIAVLFPGVGDSRPPESDGSTYTWTGAATLTVDVKPWGGGYVRSDPYLIDCPFACIRAFDSNREVTLTAYMTPGHTFKAWEGACAGQGNPCTLKVSGIVDVTAILEGHYEPPAPPAPPAPSGPSPSLTAGVSGACPGCTVTVSGSGFNPNSSISGSIAYSSPPGISGSFSATSDATGSWSFGFTETCNFGGSPFSGAVERDITATDSGGASASTHVSTSCP
jgi:hypothetical protein